jgi:hypothetical protein
MHESKLNKCILIYEDDPELLLLCKTILLKVNTILKHHQDVKM